MLNPKEIIIVLTVSIIFAFLLTLMESLEIFAYALLASFLVILLNIVGKKVMAFYFDTEIKIKFWEVSQYGFRPNQRFRNPFPAGVFLPIITTAFSFGYITWLASLTFQTRPKVYRAARRHGLYSFSEIPEYHIGLIAAAGIFANLLFAGIGYLINFPEFMRINLYYALFNMIPLSELDGNKILFGSKLLWSVLAIIILIAITMSFVII